MMMINIFTLLFRLNVAHGILLSSELKFDKNDFSMKEVPLIKNMIISKVSLLNNSKQEVVWMKLEGSVNETLTDICQYDHGLIIDLQLKNTSIKACFSKQKDIGFQTQIYKSMSLVNVHRFQFPLGTHKKDIEKFFSLLEYMPESFKK